VSRCLTGLKRRGIIQLAGPRCLNIVDREALQEGMGGIFGTADEQRKPPLARAGFPKIPSNAFGGVGRPPLPPSFTTRRMAAESRSS
jgi:hypothetical protein